MPAFSPTSRLVRIPATGDTKLSMTTGCAPLSRRHRGAVRGQPIPLADTPSPTAGRRVRLADTERRQRQTSTEVGRVRRLVEDGDTGWPALGVCERASDVTGRGSRN